MRRRIFYILVIFLLLAGCGKEQAAIPTQQTEAEVKKAQTLSLYNAVWGADLEKLKELIASGADVNSYDPGELPLLCEALAYEYFEGFDFLVAKGADVNMRYGDGKTPLHIMLEDLPEKKLIEKLIENGADLTAKNSLGYTPLDVALLKGEEDIAETIRNHDGRMSEGYELIHFTEKGDVAKVKELIKRGVDVNWRQKPDNETPLHIAIWEDHTSIVKILIAAGADVNARDWAHATPLHRAGNKEIAKALIDAGADPNAKDEEGLTPLYFVSPEVAKFLIENGANVNIRTQYGRTLLHEPRYQAITELFISKGVDVNARDIVGRTALHNAAEKGKSDIVKTLITRGAKVNAIGGRDITPLHYAVYKEHQETVKILIAGGADVNARNGQGKTPLDLAMKEGYNKITKLLRKHGARTSEELGKQEK